MADAKISDLTGAAAAAGANEIPINEAGTTKKLTVTQLQTFVNTAPVFAAQTASANTAVKLTAGTLNTTAEDGAIELDNDCFYGCVDAGNRGVWPTVHIIRADATRTFTSNTSQQAIFTTPSNGRLTLETGVYFFEGLISMDTMSGTSGNGKWSLIGAGTASLGAILQQVHGQDIALDSISASSGVSLATATVTATNTSTANASTVYTFTVKGTFEVTGAGTIIPSFAQTTAAAAVVKIGSFFMCWRGGSTSMTSVGQWS